MIYVRTLSVFLPLFCIIFYTSIDDVFSEQVNLTFVGSATILNGSIQLTPNSANVVGAVWMTKPLSVKNSGSVYVPGFSVNTSFRVGFSDSYQGPGFSFCVQNISSEAIGDNGLIDGVPSGSFGFRLNYFNAYQYATLEWIPFLNYSIYDVVPVDQFWHSLSIQYDYFRKTATVTIDGNSFTEQNADWFVSPNGDNVWLGFVAANGGSTVTQANFLSENISVAILSNASAMTGILSTSSSSSSTSSTAASVSSVSTNTSNNSGTTGAIILGVLFGVVSLAEGAALAFLIWKAKRKDNENQEEPKQSPATIEASQTIVSGQAIAGNPQEENERNSSTEMNSLSRKRFTKDHVLRDFEKLLLDSFSFVKCITSFTQATESDRVARSLSVVFEVHEKTVELIKVLITKEVEISTQAGTLFRGNSFASKLMKEFSALIGKPLLKSVLGEFIEQICKETLESNISFEIDPSKLNPEEDLETNQERLQFTCSKLLRKILDSADDSPLEFREICNHLQKQVASKFPGSSQSCIGGFLFLRYFCPAIVAPSAFGVISQPPNEKAQRGLTLIAKTLQNIANNISFGNKEVYMEWLNPFVTGNFSACQDYFDEMATIPVQMTEHCKVEINPKKLKESVDYLFRHVKSISPSIPEKYSSKDFYPLLNELLLDSDYIDKKLKECVDTNVNNNGKKKKKEEKRSSVNLT